MVIACHARSASCDVVPSQFRANAAEVKIPLDLHGFLMDKNDESGSL
jgi:hypothetical protein